MDSNLVNVVEDLMEDGRNLISFYGQSETEIKEDAKRIALKIDEEKTNAVIHVVGQLKSRGLISEKDYLIVCDDIANETEQIKQLIKVL